MKTILEERFKNRLSFHLLPCLLFFMVAAFLMCPRPLLATTVYLDTLPEQTVGLEFSIDVRIDAVNGIYGAAYDLVYDPEFIEVVDSDAGAEGVQPKVSEGNLLNDGGGDTTFLRAALEDETPGNVVVGISRSGDVDGVDAPSDTVILTVNFVSKKTGDTTIIFNRQGLKDPDNSDITVTSWDGLTITIIPLAPGDTDGSGTISLQDAILALQVASGIAPAVPIHKETGIKGDEKIGLEEAIYVLQFVSGLR